MSVTWLHNTGLYEQYKPCRLMCKARLPVVDWTDAPADLKGLVRFAGRRNLVYARVSSHFKRSLQWVPGFFPGVKSGRGVTLIPHSFQCRGHGRVELYVYSPYGPYGLYRASVPVQGCTLPFTYYATNYFNRENFCISPKQCSYVLSTILPTAIISLKTISSSFL